MLMELQHVRQIEGEPERRWFMDEFFDLIVWIASDQSIAGFQLCYDKEHTPNALTWRRESGFQHQSIDDGEARPSRLKMSPVLTPLQSPAQNKLPKDVLDIFRNACQGIDRMIAAFVYIKLTEYAAQPQSTRHND